MCGDYDFGVNSEHIAWLSLSPSAQFIFRFGRKESDFEISRTVAAIFEAT